MESDFPLTANKLSVRATNQLIPINHLTGEQRTPWKEFHGKPQLGHCHHLIHLYHYHHHHHHHHHHQHHHHHLRHRRLTIPASSLMTSSSNVCARQTTVGKHWAPIKSFDSTSFQDHVIVSRSTSLVIFRWGNRTKSGMQTK